MNRKLLIKVLMFMVCFLGIGSSSYAQFKVEEDFKGSAPKQQNVVFKGDAYLTASTKNTTKFKDVDGDGWLRLTEDVGGKNGGVIIDEAFKSEKGVVLDFEYKTWRTVAGNDKPPVGKADRGGDGFTVFLIDGKILGNDVTLGGNGHHLGYGGDYYLDDKDGNKPKNTAITGGYLGLGLDEYGNYIFSGTNGYYYSHGIVNGQWISHDEAEDMRYSLKNSIGLRGKSVLSTNTTPLIGFTTLDKGGYEVGYPSILTDRPSDVVFYRRVQMELYKYGNGYRVEVRWMREKGGTFEHLFTSEYTEAPFDTLKIGFAASTGSAVNFHEIRGLSVFVPEGVKVEKKVNKDTLIVGEDLEYTVEVRNLSQSVYTGVVLNDLLDDLKPYFEVESISFRSELSLAETKATNFNTSLKTLKDISINLGSRDAAVFTIKGKVKQIPSSGKLVNTANMDVSKLGFTSEEAKDPKRLTSTVVTKVNPEGACGCPVGAIELTNSSDLVTLEAGKSYCVSKEISLTGSLTILPGASLYIQSGAKLKVTGFFTQQGGLVSICPKGGVDLTGSAMIGHGGKGDSKIVMREGSYFTATGSFMQYEPTGGKVSIDMYDSSIVEVCGTFTQQATTYPLVNYVGKGKRNSYFIVKAQANGGPNSVLTDSDNVNVIAMNTVIDLKIGSKNYCGPEARKGNCSIWPEGLTDAIHSKCHEAEGIVDRPALQFKKQGKYVQGDRSMYTKETLDYAAASMIGDRIEYTFTVKNTGNVALHDVKVNDPKLPNVTPTYKSGDVNDNKLLDEGEEWVYDAIYFITQEDIDNTEKVNQATVNALTDTNKVVSKISGTDYTNENPTIVPLPFGAVDNNFCDNEGDQFISGFHTTIVKTKYGFEIFGERGLADGGKNSHAYRPVKIIPANGFNYKGAPMFATMGTIGNQKSQFFLLTSKGLYAWGTVGTVISEINTTSTEFQEITLPNGVKPSDINYITASYKVLVLKTKSGKLYVQGVEPKLYGDGTTKADANWHTVKLKSGSDLTNVKSVKVHTNGGFALLNDNTFVSWGETKYNGKDKITTDSRAEVVSSPIESEQKARMIAITGSSNDNKKSYSLSYVVLSTSGKVYSIGGNAYGQLGNGEGGGSSDKTTWQVVKIDKNTDLTDVIFITGADNSSYEAAAGAINKFGKLYLWGRNSSNMLGQPGADSNIVFAKVPDGFLDATGKLLTKAVYVELGGHTTMFMGENYRFCYVGHKVNGSMGDGYEGDTKVNSFDCTNTPHISEMCAKLTIEPEPGLSIIKDGVYIGKGTDKSIVADGIIKYTITVSNTGNTALSNIEVTDPKLPKFIGTIGSLNAGENKVYEVDYIVTQDDIDRGGVFNQAAGKGNSPTSPVTGKSKPTTPVDVKDPNYPLEDPAYKNCETCTVTILEQQPSITLVKVGVVDEDANTTAGNGVINYTFTIKNTGNVSLTVDDFIDSIIDPFIPVFKKGEGTGNRLEVGKTWTATATYEITDKDVEVEKVENQATVKGKAPKGKKVEAISGTEQGNTTPTITPVEGGGPLITNPHIYHKVQ